jgi:hypothetical protein
MIGYKSTTSGMFLVFLNLPHQPLSKPLPPPSACLFLFLGFDLFGVGRARADVSLRNISLFFIAPVACVWHVSLRYISLFFIAHAGSLQTPSRITFANPFWTVRAPFACVWHVSLCNISLFFIVHAGSLQTPSRITFANPFWTVRAPFLFRLPPHAHLHDSICMSVLTACLPTLSHVP